MGIAHTSDAERFSRYVESYTKAGLAFENQASRERDPEMRDRLLRKAAEQKRQAQFYRDKLAAL